MTKLAARKTRLSFTTGAEIRYRGKMRAVIVEVDSPFAASVRLSYTIGPATSSRGKEVACTR